MSFSTRQEQILVNKIAALLRLLKRDIDDDYRVEGCESDTTPSMQITLGMSADGSWGYQTGDNSFTGGAYGHAYWGVDTLTRTCNAKETAQRLVSQCIEQMEDES